MPFGVNISSITLALWPILKRVVTILENADVPENIVADIVGREKRTMTFRLYSGGARHPTAGHRADRQSPPDSDKSIML